MLLCMIILWLGNMALNLDILIHFFVVAYLCQLCHVWDGLKIVIILALVLTMIRRPEILVWLLRLYHWISFVMVYMYAYLSMYNYVITVYRFFPSSILIVYPYLGLVYYYVYPYFALFVYCPMTYGIVLWTWIMVCIG